MKNQIITICLLVFVAVKSVCATPFSERQCVSEGGMEKDGLFMHCIRYTDSDGSWKRGYTLTFNPAKMLYSGNNPNAYKSLLSGEVIIPQTIELNGCVYPCVGIEYDAFSNENMSRIKIPGTVNFISEMSFQQCPELEELDLSSMLNYDFCQGVVGACPKLKVLRLSASRTIYTGSVKREVSSGNFFPALEEIYSPAETPVENEVFFFSSIGQGTFDNCKVYVQAQSIGQYQNHPNWGKFKNIIPYDFKADIEVVEPEEKGRYMVYNCRGQYLGDTVHNLERGFYIIRYKGHNPEKIFKF